MQQWLHQRTADNVAVDAKSAGRSGGSRGGCDRGGRNGWNCTGPLLKILTGAPANSKMRNWKSRGLRNGDEMQSVDVYTIEHRQYMAPFKYSNFTVELGRDHPNSEYNMDGVEIDVPPHGAITFIEGRSDHRRHRHRQLMLTSRDALAACRTRGMEVSANGRQDEGRQFVG